MKKKILVIAAAAAIALSLQPGKAGAQNTAGITAVLLQKNIITQREADSINTVAAFNEKVNAKNRTFIIGAEFRPRGEYRNGYRQLRTDTSHAAYFGTQRSRLLFTFSQPGIKLHLSVQDIRVWGQYGQPSISGSLSVFEAYAELYLKQNIFLRIGRQKVELDNGRLFSAANWSQAGKAHDGIDLVIKKEKYTTELMTFFNQTAENNYETNFSPTTFTNYKLLNVHYLKAQLSRYFTLTTINAADGYQSKAKATTLYVRGTSGGRLDYEKGNLYVTASGYYQYGRLQTGKKIAAYYLQPEVQYKLKRFTGRLGMEYMSGDNATSPALHSKSFVPLYGVAHKFMGNMDLFTSFPADLKNGGLVNPYLFVSYEVNNRWTVRSDFHLFYLQNKVKNTANVVIDKYLGFENDLSFNFKLNEVTKIEGGFAYMSAKKSLEVLSGGTAGKTPVWSYVMVTFSPELFNFKN